MTNFDIILDSIEEMDTDLLCSVFYKNFKGLYGKKITLKYFNEAFDKIKGFGNSKLRFNLKFFKVFNDEITKQINDLDYIPKLLRCKFVGNKTKNHISIFFTINNNEEVVDLCDVLDLKKKVGEIPIDKYQIVIFPIVAPPI